VADGNSPAAAVLITPEHSWSGYGGLGFFSASGALVFLVRIFQIQVSGDRHIQ